MGFDDLPILIQDALAAAVVLGVAPAVFLATWLWIRGWSKKINGHSDQLDEIKKIRAQAKIDADEQLQTEIATLRTALKKESDEKLQSEIKALRTEMQKGFDAKLMEEVAKEVAVAKEGLKAQRDADLEEFTAQLQTVAQNFSDIHAEDSAALRAKDEVILAERTAKETALASLAKMEETTNNLNLRLRDVDKKLAKQQSELDELRDAKKEAAREKETLNSLLVQLKRETAEAHDRNVLQQAVIDALMEMASRVGLEFQSLKKQVAPPPPSG